jgi:RNA polymerase sigma-70 factor (ECF subfamily)
MGRDTQASRQGGGAGVEPSRSQGSLLTVEQLERVRSRDPEALGALFDAYIGRIFGLAFRMTGDRAAAEDVTQETFLKVHRAAHQLDPDRDPGPWLLTIAANICRGGWRSRGGQQDQKTLSLDAKPEAVANVRDAGTDPEQDAQAADEKRRLEKALDELPEDMRMVVVLHDLQGMTHEEISAVTGDAPPAVRKRYSRALGKLRELLQEKAP